MMNDQYDTSTNNNNDDEGGDERRRRYNIYGLIMLLIGILLLITMGILIPLWLLHNDGNDNTNSSGEEDANEVIPINLDVTSSIENNSNSNSNSENNESDSKNVTAAATTTTGSIISSQIKFNITIVPTMLMVPTSSNTTTSISQELRIGLEDTWSIFMEQFFVNAISFIIEDHEDQRMLRILSSSTSTSSSSSSSTRRNSLQEIVKGLEYISDSAQINTFEVADTTEFTIVYNVQAGYQYVLQRTSNNTTTLNDRESSTLSSTATIHSDIESSILKELSQQSKFSATLQQRVPDIPLLSITPTMEEISTNDDDGNQTINGTYFFSNNSTTANNSIDSINQNHQIQSEFNNNSNNNNNNNTAEPEVLPVFTYTSDRYSCNQILETTESISLVEIPYKYIILIDEMVYLHTNYNNLPLIEVTTQRMNFEFVSRWMHIIAKELEKKLLHAVVTQFGLLDGRICTIPPINSPWFIEITSYPLDNIISSNFTNCTTIIKDISNNDERKCSLYSGSINATLIGSDKYIDSLSSFLQQTFLNTISDNITTIIETNLNATIGYTASFSQSINIPPTPSPSPSPPTFMSSNIFNNPSSSMEDPWEEIIHIEDIILWDKGNASTLDLTVINALDNQWQDLFEIVLPEWNNGDPKVLNLSVEQHDHEPNCEPVNDKIKVCNGNYGDTSWRGINQVLVHNDKIIAATAKMNDYYLANANDAMRRYTLCHEMGHSFSLPHSDENFFNDDLGTCMDYTTQPQNNASPNQADFELLAKMYGNSAANSNSTATLIPEEIRSQFHSLLAFTKEHDFRRSASSESQEFVLGEGWSVKVSKMHVLR